MTTPSPSPAAPPASREDSRTRIDSIPTQKHFSPACPTDDTLAAFLNETLPEESRDALCAHIDVCRLCQALLDRLTTAPESGAARVREQPSVSGAGSVSGEMTLSEESSARISASPPMPRIPGFDVIEEIGKGGMGIVYRARHRRLNRPVALKTVLAGIHADPRMIQRFFFEAEVMARVRHPQVVEVFEANSYQGPDGMSVPYLAMELLEGGTLRTRIASGSLALTEVAALIESIARGVHAAHLQGIVHRDLKPGNILFGSVALPKVGDFGLAKLLTPLDEDLTQSGQVIGTPAYMAPEQASGEGVLGPETDVYALGTILFEMLVGHPPFQGREAVKVLTRVMQEPAPRIDSLRPDLPRDLAAVTMKCLEKRPEQRYRSAEALADDLQRFRENRPTTARPMSKVERTRRWAARNPAVASLLAALASVLLVGIVSVLLLWQKAERNAEEERIARSAAVAAEGVAEDALKVADTRQARLEFDRGTALCEEGQVEAGLQHFHRALELAEKTGSADLARVTRIDLALWPQRLFTRVRTVSPGSMTKAAAFTPDGSRFVAVGHDGRVAIWDSGTGRELFKPEVPPSKDPATLAFLCVAVSPNGERIAAGDHEGNILVWDAKGVLIKILPTSPGGLVPSIAFAPDGTLWAAEGQNGARRWNLATGEAVGEASGRMIRSPVLTLALNADGSRLYLGDRGGFVLEWDTAANRVARGWPMADPIADIALNADESALAMTGPGGRCLIIDLKTNRIDHEISLLGAAGNAVAFDGELLLVADGDGSVRAFHRATGQPVGVPLAFAGTISSVNVRPGSDEFAVCSSETVTLCRPPRAGWQPLMTGAGRVASVAFQAEGKTLAVTAGKQVTQIDTGDPTQQKSFPLEPQAAVTSPPAVKLPDGAVAVSSTVDGSRMLVGLQNNSAIWIDAATGKELIPALTHGRAVTAVALSPDASTLLTGSRDGTARLWDAKTGLPLGPILRHAGPVTAVAFSPTGKQVVTGTSNGHVLSWQVP